MSEMVVQARMLVCDLPGCQKLGGNLEWLHTEDGQDYCPEHWHWEENDPTPGPGSESGLCHEIRLVPRTDPGHQRPHRPVRRLRGRT